MPGIVISASRKSLLLAQNKKSLQTRALPTAPALTVATPSGAISGLAMAVSGTFSSGTPSGFSFSFSGGGGSGTLANPTLSGANWSGTCTAPASPGSYTLTIAGQGANTASATTRAFNVSSADASAVTTFSLTNAADSAVANPVWSFNLNFAKGDVPAGSYPAIYGAAGALVAGQQHDYARTWSDGSLRRATFSFVSPDTFAANGAAGSSASYSVKSVLGAPNTTPLVTLADVAAQNIKLLFSGFDCGSDSFELSLNDLLNPANNVGSGSYVGTLKTSAPSSSGAGTLSFASLSATVTDADGASLPFQAAVGMQVSAAGIPSGTHVTAISGTTLTLSAKLTGAIASGATITFGYPVWTYEVIKSGPVCSEWKFRGLLRRVSDGAWHKWAYATIFLKAWGKAGPWEFTVRADQGNCYGPHPTGSVGTVLASNGSSTLADASPQPRFAAPATLYNGTTVIANFGGPNDWTAFTTSASALPASGGYVNPPGAAYPVDATGLRSLIGTGWAFSPGSGTLPAGISANAVYWFAYIPYSSPSQYVLCTQKFHAVQIGGGFEAPPAWAPGTAVTGSTGGYSYYQTSDGTIWYAVTSGTTGSTPPSGRGTVTTSDGITWQQATQVISGGAGTITLFQVPVLYGNTAWLGKDQYGSAVWWRGAGSLAARPKLMLAPEFTYFSTKTTAIPPLNPSIATSPHNAGATVPLPTTFSFDYDRAGANINYYHSYQPNNAPPWSPPWNMSNYGDDPGDERVGPLSFQSAWLLLQPTSPILNQLVRCLGYSQVDWPIWLINEQSGYMWATNEGPARIATFGGSNYAGLGNTDPSASGVQSAYWPTINTQPPHGLPLYLNAYGPVIDALHCQQLAFVPFLLDGDAVDWETCVYMANALGLSNGGNYPQTYAYPNFNKNYGGTVASLSGNPRGMAWAMRALANAEFMMPNGTPLYHYVRDCMDDSANVYTTFYGDPANIPGGSGQIAQGILNGFDESYEIFAGAGCTQGPGFQFAMQWFVWAWQAWRESFEGRRPAFKNFLTGYMAPQINIMNGDYVPKGSDYYAGPHSWAIASGTPGSNVFFASATAAIEANFPTGIHGNIPAANLAVNDARGYDNFTVAGFTGLDTARAAAAGSKTIVVQNGPPGTAYAISDVTNPGAIPSGTYITALSGSGPYTLTLSQAIASPGVSNGDSIYYFAAATAAAAVPVGATSLTVSNLPQNAGPGLGNADSQAIPAQATFTVASGSTLTLSVPVVSPGVAKGELIYFSSPQNVYGGNSTTLGAPPGNYPWDTNAYPTMTLAAFAMLSWAGFPGAQNVYNRLKTRINTAPCQGITWAQTANAHYDGGRPAAYCAWNYISASGS